MYVYVCMCVYLYISLYIYIYIHTHIMYICIVCEDFRTLRTRRPSVVAEPSSCRAHLFRHSFRSAQVRAYDDRA